jgi:uncharacterized protein DUF6064
MDRGMPFTSEQFLGVFRQYNDAVWPAQWLFNALGAGAVIVALRRPPAGGRALLLVLAGLWIWMGVVYHLLFFASINRAAIAFGVLFVVEGVLLLRLGIAQPELRFRPRRDTRGVAGAMLVSYAMVFYPILGFVLGRRYPAMPTFGLPCPTTIFTFGLLLWADGRVPTRVIVIPALWSLLGFTAALSLGITEDLGLLVAGAVGTALITARHRGSERHVLPAASVPSGRVSDSHRVH